MFSLCIDSLTNRDELSRTGPRSVPPENRLMEGESLPDGARVDTIVEVDNESTPPIAANRRRMAPTSRTSHLVRREVVGVDLSLGQVISSSNFTLRFPLGELWKNIDEVLIPIL